MKLSIIMPVYNEAFLLHHSLVTTLPYVDELVIIDGSPYGPSSDGTWEIIQHFKRVYPHKVICEQGEYRIGENTWDESAHRNRLLELASGDVIIPHCGDMIYTARDFARFTEAIRANPSCKLFYTYFIEFWLNHNHIRLYPGYAMEESLPVPAIGDLNAISRDVIECYERGPNIRFVNGFGFNLKEILFAHEVRRYHYGWICGFAKQVERHFRNIKLGAWLKFGDELMAKGDKEIIRWAIKHVQGYPNEGCDSPYFGVRPLGHISMGYNVGMGEAIERLKNQYGDDICEG